MSARLPRVCAIAALVLGLSQAGPAAARSLLDTAGDSGSFTVFLAAVKAAGLTETLSGPGPTTVFAPSDDAFGKLPKTVYESLFKPENKARLKDVLTHHLIAGAVFARDFAGKRVEAEPLSGEPLLIDATRAPTIDGARITRPDLKADNGVIHVIDTVLMPK